MTPASLVGPRSLVADLESVRAGAVSADELQARCLDGIEALDPMVHAFLPEPRRRERLARTVAVAGPLTGALLGVKDVFGVTGMPTRAGSSLPEGAIALPQAAAVSRLLAAGAVVAGRTETAEFAHAAPGPTVNPHDPHRTPGGSSSGSAAAVAAGMVPLALGNQTIGSVIRPAAYCGVVGFRSTVGRIPTDGVLANAPTLDTVGLFAADVASVALAASVLCDGWDPSRRTDRPPVVGVVGDPMLDQVDPDARTRFTDRVQRLREAGFVVLADPVTDDVDRTMATIRTINRYEFARGHADRYAEWGDRYRPESVAAVEEGRAISADRYAEALADRSSFVARLEAVMVERGIDLWLAPGATGPAPLGLARTGDSAMCYPFSLAGLPAVTLPADQDTDGMPLGLQLVGRRGEDERLLDWAGRIGSC